LRATGIHGIRVAARLALAVGAVMPPAPSWAQESRIDPLRAEANAAPPADRWRASLALGRALRRAGHLPEAEGELRRGMGLAGANADAVIPLHEELARVYADRRDFAHALATCQHLSTVRGAEARMHACLAEAHLVWQRASLALSEAAAALAKDPSCFEAKVAQGRAYEFALDYPAAEASLRDAIGLRPDDAYAHRALSHALMSEGRRDDAVAELRKAISLDYLDPDTAFELAVALPPGPESVGFLERATRERPSFARAWVELGARQLASGDVAAAAASQQAAARSDSASADVRVLGGQIALAQGRPDDAIKAAQAALKVVANSASAELLVADANARKGEIDLALEAYQAAWGFDHRDPASLVHASVACHAAGRDTSARAFGVKATQEFPELGPGWAALGDALVGQGERQAAKDAYGKALAAKEGAVDRDAVQRKLAALR
jgi:tetratricopeptide (TPR) repeat protein